MKAVIMAGGKGTRIRSIAGDIPKSMIPVSGKPVLGYQLDNLARSGIRDVILVVGYMGEQIKAYFGDGAQLGLNIEYFMESSPLGTAGALYHLKDKLGEDFILIMGDLMMSVDIGRFAAAHRNSGAWITLFTHPNTHPYDSDIIVTDECGKISSYTEDQCGEDKAVSARALAAAKEVIGFIGKHDKRDFYYHNLVNAGLYMISPAALGRITGPGKTDLDRDIVRPLIGQGKVFSYRSTEYVRDMGTPDRYDEVVHAVSSGLIEKRNLGNPQKCVFIDRDGTVNIEMGFIKDPGDIRLIDGAGEAVGRINHSEYLCIIITNQPVIARGDAGFGTFDEIMKALEVKLGEKGAYVDDIYYCPHHPDSGFEGEIRELKFRCNCRKPGPGMIFRAAAEHNIDLKNSFMIGDSTTDVLSGINAGVGTIGLKTGRGLSDARCAAKPDFTADDLSEAADIILSGGHRTGSSVPDEYKEKG